MLIKYRDISEINDKFSLKMPRNGKFFFNPRKKTFHLILYIRNLIKKVNLFYLAEKCRTGNTPTMQSWFTTAGGKIISTKTLMAIFLHIFYPNAVKLFSIITYLRNKPQHAMMLTLPSHPCYCHKVFLSYVN